MEKYIVIGFNEEYKNEGIEPYYMEIRHEDNHDSDEILEWKYTEIEIREVAEQKAKQLNIPFLKELMIW